MVLLSTFFSADLRTCETALKLQYDGTPYLGNSVKHVYICGEAPQFKYIIRLARKDDLGKFLFSTLSHLALVKI